MSAPTQGQRNLKNAYRKKGFQTPYTKQGDSVNPNPPPVSSYGTTTTAPTSVHRKGLTSPVQQRPVRSRFGDRDSFRSYNYNITPWHLYPKADSSNVIKREKLATGTVADGASVDIQTVYLTDNGLAPSAGGSPLGEFWRIKKFGHAELNGVAGITYQIVIDGQISLDWLDFQLSPTTPSNQMFEFENPLVVKNSFIFRVVNNSGGGYNFATPGNEVDSMIVGWTEQYTASAETSHEDIEQS
tara:strand:+ start:2939 stop:3664 length:726 start_codon:yes stop_codon:yes gene_type:complete